MGVHQVNFDKFKPEDGWSWGAVEDIIYTGIRAVQKLPDKEARFLVQRVFWPNMGRDHSKIVNALSTAENDQERIEALKGTFTIEGYRGGIPQADIDQIEPAFELIAMVKDKDRRFFNSVMRSKIENCGRVDWTDVRKELGLPFHIKSDTIYKRYQRMLMAVAVRL